MSASPAPNVRWHDCADAPTLAQRACDWIADAAARAIAARGRFDLVLAGGNTPRAAYEALRAAQTDWARWRIWFGDERCAQVDDPQRNSVMARAALLDHVPISLSNIHVIAGERGAQAAAAAYAVDLNAIVEFDLVLLGLGEDGHTASLFPGHDWGEGNDAPPALPVFAAPKPPPQRVSLSAARLSQAREVLFLIEGQGKRDALARWRAGVAIPAAAIHPINGVDVLVAPPMSL